MNSIIERAGTPDIACSALLACLFVTLIILIRMLWMLYQDEREINEDRRFRDKCRREILEVARMLLQSQVGDLGNLAQEREDNAHVINDGTKPLRMRPHIFGALLHAYQMSKDLLSQFLFGGHKSNARKQANS